MIGHRSILVITKANETLAFINASLALSHVRPYGKAKYLLETIFSFCLKSLIISCVDNVSISLVLGYLVL